MYHCCDELRRSKLRGTGINGIDYLEIDAGDLLVHFVSAQHVATLNTGMVRIDGGERIRHVRVIDAEQEPGTPNVLRVVLSEQGDFSRYTLRLVHGSDDDRPPAGFDPALSSVTFSFRIDCQSDFDCRPTHRCPPVFRSEPEIDYLAKDYGSFRRLMLDRLAVLMPAWRDRGAADGSITVVEALAYLADTLSYYQDAIATEAYLNTARRRVSVRRHARLVDYRMHDGCNARAWVQIRVNDRGVPITAGTTLLTRINGQLPRIQPDSSEHQQALRSQPAVFEVMHDVLLFEPHNDITFYTWSDERCCLPRGAVQATLLDGGDDDTRLRLCAGDVLVFEERYGPTTGHPADADPAHRHAVRLVRVEPEATRKFEQHTEVDRTIGAPRVDPVTGQRIVEIEWAPEDRLPFPLCLSEIDTPDGRRPASFALGNIVLADHGASVARPEDLGTVPAPIVTPRAGDGSSYCDGPSTVVTRPRFRPRLQQAPLTHAVPYDSSLAATLELASDPTKALPALTAFTPDRTWNVRRDLLDSGPGDHDLVVEIESDGTAFLRFGDGRHGARVESGAQFTARYRVGNGVGGNVGAHAIAHIVTAETRITSVTNPLSARGGTDSESIESVRQCAPVAFRTQKRAVTRDDYEALSAQFPGVQRAAATFRWTGSWHTAFVSVDRMGGVPVDDKFDLGLRRHLEPYRLAGYDVEVDNPTLVPLEIEMRVCVKPDYFRSDVKAALLEVFSSRTLEDGRRGVFHPDNFSFGEPVYLSPLYAAAQNVDGVASLQVTTFQRLGVPDPEPLEIGKLLLGKLEIATLDNDPTFPDRGIYRLTLGGGK